MNEYTGIMPTKVELTLEQSQQGVSNDILVSRWWRYPILAEVNSSPHAYAQTTKTYYKHQDSRIKKAQYEHVGQDTRSQGGKDDKTNKEKDLKISELKTKLKDNDKGSRIKITQHEGTSLQQDKDQVQDSRTQLIKTYGELGHEHKFITEIIARRANGCIVSITEPDYKNLNKNDIEDMYLLIVNGKVEDYAETELLWSLSVFIRSTVIWERVHDFQLVYGIIYKNSKKEKRVMRHQEVHKFYDATLKKVLEGLKSYNNDVKHGYVTPSLSNEDDEYLQLFEEEIEERMKHRD
ncbi:hypothetical protein Tco_1099333 [Tanacetum coccineum]